MPNENEPSMRLSIVIPVLNEVECIASTLERLAEQVPEAQRIVVDGGSDDGTLERLRRLAAPSLLVIHSPPGRAHQLNAGAAAAQGAWLLFLHVDTLLPPQFDRAISEAEKQRREVGVFSLCIRGRHPMLRASSWGANWRSRHRSLFLGDQALFIRRARFESLGGFDASLPLLEDYVFAHRLKARGVPLYLSPLRVETSGRRWDEQGYWRTWWQMRRIFRAYRRQHNLKHLAAGYRHVR